MRLRLSDGRYDGTIGGLVLGRPGWVSDWCWLLTRLGVVTLAWRDFDCGFFLLACKEKLICLAKPQNVRRNVLIRNDCVIGLIHPLGSTRVVSRDPLFVRSLFKTERNPWSGLAGYRFPSSDGWNWSACLTHQKLHPPRLLHVCHRILPSQFLIDERYSASCVWDLTNLKQPSGHLREGRCDIQRVFRKLGSSPVVGAYGSQD